MRCIQCESSECGEFRCRFTALSHEEFRKQRALADRYADAMIRRDKERPKWERDFATGAGDPDIRSY